MGHILVQQMTGRCFTNLEFLASVEMFMVIAKDYIYMVIQRIQVPLALWDHISIQLVGMVCHVMNMHLMWLYHQFGYLLSTHLGT
jgi:hypothetical protein